MLEYNSYNSPPASPTPTPTLIAHQSPSNGGHPGQPDIAASSVDLCSERTPAIDGLGRFDRLLGRIATLVGCGADGEAFEWRGYGSGIEKPPVTSKPTESADSFDMYMSPIARSTAGDPAIYRDAITPWQGYGDGIETGDERARIERQSAIGRALGRLVAWVYGPPDGKGRHRKVDAKTPNQSPSRLIRHATA